MMDLPEEKLDGTARTIMGAANDVMAKLARENAKHLGGYSVSWEDIGDFIGSGIPAVSETAAKVTLKGIKEVAGKARNGVSQTWTKAKETAANAWDQISNAAQNTWGKIKDTAAQTWDGVSNTAQKAWVKIKDTSTQTWNGVKSFFKKAGEGLGSVFGKEKQEESREQDEKIVSGSDSVRAKKSIRKEERDIEKHKDGFDSKTGRRMPVSEPAVVKHNEEKKLSIVDYQKAIRAIREKESAGGSGYAEKAASEMIRGKSKAKDR